MINEQELKIKEEESQYTKEQTELSLPSPARSDDEKAKYFFNKVCKFILTNKFKQPQKSDVAFFLVTHIVTTLPYFLDAIKKIGKIALIIPKSSQKNLAVYDEVKKNYKLQLFSKDNPNIGNYIHEQDSNNEEAIKFRPIIEKHAIGIIKKVLELEKQSFLIIDIGGYFAPCLENICYEFKEQFLGVVEDTENGHKKYEKLLHQKAIYCPIISVARSELKKNEDYPVGKAIVEAAIRLIEASTSKKLTDMTIGIIGFGKIGESIAAHLKMRNIKNIRIIDDKDSKMDNIETKHFTASNRAELLKTCDVIFCATGNKSLVMDEFFCLKNNVFIVSCTSADDEFDLRSLQKKSEHTKEGYIDRYCFKDGDTNKTVNLLHGGNAVNFVYDIEYDSHVFPVLASLMVCSTNLIIKEQLEFGKIQSINERDTEKIARYKRKVFGNYCLEKDLRINNWDSLHQMFHSPLTTPDLKAFSYFYFADNLLKKKGNYRKGFLIKFLLRSALTLDHSISKDISELLKSDVYKQIFKINEGEISAFKDKQEEQETYLEVIKKYSDLEYLKNFIFHLCDNVLKEPTITAKYILILYWIKLYYAQNMKNAYFTAKNEIYLLKFISMPSKDWDEFMQNETYLKIVKNIISCVLKDREIEPVIIGKIEDLVKMFNQEFKETEEFPSVFQHKK